MARYRGPKAKVSRKFGEPIFGASRALQKKNYPPGQHGRTKRRKQSDYAVQLQEKQKAKYIYGLLERQFRNFFEKASRKSGITGEILLQMLESRLDNVVYRMGIAPSRRAARQLVIHKHITVNSEVISMPSYILKAGDLVGVREKSKSMEAIVNSLSSRGKKYPWMEWDNHLMVGRYVSIPTREEIPENIQEQLIVELYSK